MSSDSIEQLPGPSVSTPDSVDGRPVRRPDGIGAYQFVVVSALRASQLMRGCVPRVDVGTHRATVIAQLEVASGMIGDLNGQASAGSVVDE
jgi:hypothetical protein